MLTLSRIARTRARGRVPAGAIVVGVVAILFAGMVVLGRMGRGREWERRKAAALDAARSFSQGSFRIALQDATSFAQDQGRSDWLQALSADLEAVLAQSHADSVRKLGERAAGGDRVAALTDWKGLWAVHQATPPSAVRERRDAELRELGVRLAHGMALAEVDAGRPGTAFLQHATADELLAPQAQGEAAVRIHAELFARLGAWLASQREPIAVAIASGDDRRISAVAAPAAAVLAALREHDARPGARPDPALVAAFEQALAPVPARRVVISVTGDEAVAQRIRSLCRFAYPYELVFESRIAENPAPAGVAPGAWATVRVRVDWTWIDYRKESGGVQWVGDYTIPTSVALSCSVFPPEGVTVPWPTAGHHEIAPAPETIQVRKDSVRYDFDRYQRDFVNQLARGLQAHLAGWKPWELPAPAEGPR